MSTKSQKITRKKTGSDESWRDGSVAQRNLYMLNSGFMADCTFVVGAVNKKKFQCHKSILSHGSSVFYAMFNGGLQEKGEVNVEDIEPKPFKKMLEFIYSDNTELKNVNSALSVCYAANKYMINTLTLNCIDFIKKNLDADSVCKTLEFAQLIDNADLEAESLKYLQNNISDVLKCASFPHVERSTLLTILRQEDLHITSEVELYSACIRWAKANQRGGGTDLTLRRDVLGPEVLSQIRFLAMTAQEFASVVIPSKVLQLQEERDILCRLVMGTGNMPRGFNTKTESRVPIGPKEIIKLSDEFCSSLSGEHMRCKNLFSFNVNVESYIFGFQLLGLASDNPPVKDSFEVNLLLSSEVVASVKFEGEMSPDKTIEVEFKKPILLQANVCYTLQMTYSNLYVSYKTVDYADDIYTFRKYSTTSGLEFNVNYECTTISQIYIAKKVK